MSRILVGMMNTNASIQNALSNGTRVRLSDGSEALAYRDCGIGRPFDGRYVTVQRNPVTGGDRRDCGWAREQLEVIE